jgi:hypothetical protein
VGRNVHEILAVAPVAHPDLQTWRFVTAVVLLARLARVADRILGEQFFLRMVDRLADPIVAAIKKPVTVAVLDEVVKVLETGKYPENLAESPTENEFELQTIVTEKIRENRRLTGLRHVPFATEIVEAAVDTSFEGCWRSCRTRASTRSSPRWSATTASRSAPPSCWVWPTGSAVPRPPPMLGRRCGPSAPHCASSTTGIPATAGSDRGRRSVRLAGTAGRGRSSGPRRAGTPRSGPPPRGT